MAGPLRAAANFLLLGGLAFLAGCNGGSSPFAKNSLGPLSSRMPPPIAVTAMANLPPQQSALLAEALAGTAARRHFAIVQGSFAEGYKLAGIFGATPQGTVVSLSYRWVLTGNTGGTLHVIEGAEQAPLSGNDPWAGIDQRMLLRIAAVTAEGLSSRLAELGFSTRAEGMPPPLDTFAEAGPGAEKDIDYETYYGSLAAAAAAGKPVPPPAPTPPPAPSGPLAGQAAVGQAPPDAAGAPAGNRSEIRAVAVTEVRGSPGKGNQELVLAMRRTLAEAGWPVLEEARPDAFTIVGEVALGPASGGAQRVRVDWTVKMPDGKAIGTIKQANDVPSGSLDKGWGDTAYYATQAAAEGIFQVVNSMRQSASWHFRQPIVIDPSSCERRRWRMKIVCGNSNRPLAEAIAAYLKLPLAKCVVRRFADMEVFVEIQENVRGEDVFVIQSTSFPANDHLMELLIIIDALRRASARRITAVMPYFGYARQDRKPGPRTPISAKLVANMIERAGADRVLTLDLHAGQIQGFFDIPTDNLFSGPVMVRDIRERFDGAKLTVISPDVGGVVRARGLAKRIGAPLAIVDKRRERANESEVMNIIGDVRGRSCILVDDIVDSGGTLCNAAEALLEEGATDVCAYITHGVLSGGAVARITASKLKELVITDSIQATEAVRVSRNIRVLSIAPLIGEAAGRTSREESVSSLFD